MKQSDTMHVAYTEWVISLGPYSTVLDWSVLFAAPDSGRIIGQMTISPAWVGQASEELKFASKAKFNILPSFASPSLSYHLAILLCSYRIYQALWASSFFPNTFWGLEI